MARRRKFGRRIGRLLRKNKGKILGGIKSGLRKTKLISSGLDRLGRSVPRLMPLTTIASMAARQKGFGPYTPAQGGTGRRRRRKSRGMRHVLT